MPVRTPAVKTNQNSENGKKTFQPSRMSWS
jgi:hypothetical protein